MSTRRAATVLLGTTLLVGLQVAPAAAGHQIQHIEPALPAVDRFAADVPRLTDAEWGIPVGGFGGITVGAEVTRAPVIFVHGNVVDHGDWYPVRQDFLDAGWTDQELWALSYNGMGNGSGSSPARSNPERDADHAGTDGLPRGTNNDVNVADLAAFVRMVQTYTGSDRVHLVGHSLGVTLIRKMMVVEPLLAQDVVSVTAIAGANHGTSLCAPMVSRGTHMSCDEIDQGTDWLAELNGPDGARETYAPTRWLTVYDGTGAGDVAFVGPSYALSPQLRGAEELVFAGMDHNGLRMAAQVVAAYRAWIEAADTAVGGASRDPLGIDVDPSPHTEGEVTASATGDGATAVAGQLPDTGGGASSGLLLVAAALGLVGATCSARQRSSHRSAGSSQPTLMRRVPGPTP